MGECRTERLRRRYAAAVSRGSRAAISLVALLLTAPPATALALDQELRLEGGANLLFESNPLRVAQAPQVAAGAREYSRVWFELREQWLSIGMGGGMAVLEYPSLRSPGPGGPAGFDRLTEWHIGARLVPGDGSRFEFEVSPTMGTRASPEDDYDEPDPEPGDVLTLPRRRDRHPAAFPATYDLRGSIPARLSILALPNLRVTLHGGGRWLMYMSAGTMLTASPSVLLRRFDGGGGARVEWSPTHAFGVRVDLGLTRSQELERFLVGTESTITRAAGAAGVVLRRDDAVRVDVRLGWAGGYDSRAGWLLAPGGLIGLVRLQVAPNPDVRLEGGVGRDVRQPLGLLGVETSAWVRFDASIVERVEPWAEFQWSYREVLTLASLNEHRWTTGTGVALRLWGGVHFEAGFRWSILNPSSNNVGEYISTRVHFGLQIRSRPGALLGDRWGSGEPLSTDEPPAPRPADRPDLGPDPRPLNRP